MRTIYKKKRELLVKVIAKLERGIKILGADAGLHLLLSVPNGMTEEELITSGLKYGIKTYGISKYYSGKGSVLKDPVLLLGFASIPEKDIEQAVQLLDKAWFSYVL
jgi:GntR family transcriptional regulator/MocR family aminotransferase